MAILKKIFILFALWYVTGFSQTESVSLTPVINLTNYALHQTQPFFGDVKKSWNETSIRLGGKIQYKSLSAQLTGIGVKTLGKDPFGTNSKSPFVHLDLAYLQWDGGENIPIKITLGRQYITLGSQFLIGDGVYDGFHPSFQQAVYHNPRKRFEAFRLESGIEKFHLDAFIYKVHRTWDGGTGEEGRFGGVDVSREFEEFKGTYSLGLFYRYSKSNLDNDMALLNLNAEQQCRFVEGLKYSGELVWEFAGKGQNAYYVTEVGQKMNEYVWHLEANYEASKIAYSPFFEVGYVYYSNDFTPVATGFSDGGNGI